MASVQKREWKGKDGKAKSCWTVRYLDGAVHRQVKFPGKKEADEFKRKVETELAAGQHLSRSSAPTIDALAREFMDHQEVRWKTREIGEGTYRATRHNVDKRIVPHFRKKATLDIRPVDVEDFYRSLRSEHRYQPKTCVEVLYTLSLMFKYAIKRRKALTNPVDEALQDLAIDARKGIQTFTTEEVERLIAALSEPLRPYETQRHRQQLRCMVFLAMFCGLRLGEILGLQKDQVQHERGFVQVRTSRTPYGEVKGPKTKAGVRDVPLPDALGVELAQLTTAGNASGFVFTTRSGSPIGHWNFRRSYWYPLLEQAGIQADIETTERGAKVRMHFHALRHFMASYLLNGRMGVAKLSKLIGHSKPSVTLAIYTHVTDDQLDRPAFEAMAGAFLPNSPLIDCAPVAQGTVTH